VTGSVVSAWRADRWGWAMLRIILRGMRGHRLRFLLTVTSVALGTALIAGTFVLTDSLGAIADTRADTLAAGFDVAVWGVTPGRAGQEQDTTPVPLPIDLVRTLREVDGVKRAVPDLIGSVVLAGRDGRVVPSATGFARGYAYDPDDPTVHLVRGRAPRSASEVVLESGALKRSRLRVGDTTRALIEDTPRQVRVVGEVKHDAPTGGVMYAAVDEATARAAFAPDGQVLSFTLVADQGVSQATLRDRVAKVLPARAEAVTAEDSRAKLATGWDGTFGVVMVFLLVFAAVSVVVGGFLIANAFTMLVGQRTRELALLQAVGATPGQVLRLVLGEAGVVGVVGGVVGLAAGVGLAKLLQVLLGLLGGLDISGGLPVAVRTVVVTVLVGLGVTVLSAVLPAIRAARIAPVAALRRDVVLVPAGLRRRAVIGIALLGVGGLLMVFALTRSAVAWGAFAAGAGLLVVGSLVFAPVAARPVVRIVTAPFVWATGPLGRLARVNALRVPRRTAATASALTIGCALVSGVSVMVESAKASMAEQIDQQLTADFVLSSQTSTMFPTTFPVPVEAVAALPGVRSVAPLSWLELRVGKDLLTASPGTGAGIADNIKIHLTSGSITALDAGQLLVNESTAERFGWKVGSTFTATIDALGRQRLTIGGIYKDAQALDDPVFTEELIAPMPLYQRTGPGRYYRAYVKAAPGTDLVALKAKITEQVKPYLVVSVQDGEEYTNSLSAQITMVMNVLYALLALSVIIAVLGIINTLALSVFERTREIGMLRAVGITAGQLSRTVTIEAVAIAVFGAALGTALGLGLGIALQHGLAAQGLHTLSIPWPRLGMIILSAALAGVVAAILPAIRAVRLDVLRAIATE
jgi:putative ABC transport system permease protein